MIAVVSHPAVQVLLACVLLLMPAVARAGTVSAEHLPVSVAVPEGDCVIVPMEYTKAEACEGIDPTQMQELWLGEGGEGIVLYVARRLTAGDLYALVMATPTNGRIDALEPFARGYFDALKSSPAGANAVAQPLDGDAPFQFRPDDAIPGFRMLLDVSEGPALPERSQMYVHAMVGTESVTVVQVFGPPGAQGEMLTYGEEIASTVETPAAPIPIGGGGSSDYAFGRNLGMVVTFALAVALILTHRDRKARSR